MRGSRSGDTARGTKQELVDGAVLGLPKFQRELVRDLLFGTVPLPPTWLGTADVLVVALDAANPLRPSEHQILGDLLEQAIRLMRDVVQPFIEQDIADRRAAGHPPSRNDVETMRRGRGPAAVRNLLFERLDHWPDQVPALGADVRRVLDEVLVRRAAYVDPVSVAAEAVVLMDDCRLIVLTYAANTGIPPREVGRLVSDVIDQLDRNAQRGIVPLDLRAWTLETAMWKWRAIRQSHGGAGTPARLAIVEPVASDPAEEVQARLEVTAWMQEAAGRLARFADRATLVGGDVATIVAHRVGAALLERFDVDLLIDVIDDSASGRQLVDAELSRRGQELTRGRRSAVQRLVRDALRDAHRRDQEPGERETS